MPSGRKTFPARAGHDGIGIGHFEPALLQILTEIQFGPADKQGTLGIHHHPHPAAFHQDIAVRRAIHQIHFILQAGTTSAHHRHPQGPLFRPPLFAQQSAQPGTGSGQNLDQPFIADFKIDRTGRRRKGGTHGKDYHRAGPAPVNLPSNPWRQGHPAKQNVAGCEVSFMIVWGAGN